jgi:hypothetical protein
MSENIDAPAPRRRGAPGVTGAIILIAIGVVLLLDNLHIASVNWLGLLRFWPVILILFGLDIIVGRQSALGSLAVAAIAVVVIGGLIWMVGVTGQWGTKPGELVTRDITEDLGDARALELNLDVGLMKTRLEALSSTGYAVQGTHKTNLDSLGLNVDYRNRGDTRILTIGQIGQQDNIGFPSDIVNELDLGLTREVPVVLVVDTGVGETALDLTGITLNSLQVKAGVGSVKIVLPDQGIFEVSIDAGVGSIDLTVPRGLEARIEYDGGLSSLNVPDRFSKKSDRVWETDGYSGATNHTQIKVNAGIGEVNIHD